MTQTPDEPTFASCSETPTSSVRGDSFSLSILMLIGVMISQRAIGLIRNVMFCGMLSEEELGRWALANNYLGWAAPFFILGLPGSFGRLSEHFRHRGQLRTMLRRMTIASGSLVAVAIAAHTLVPEWFAKLIYNQPDKAVIIPLIGLVLGSVITMNFLVDFLTSVRLNRVVSNLYLVHSLGFAVLSVLFLFLTPLREGALIAAFGIAAALAALTGIVSMARYWRELPAVAIAEPASPMWKKISSLAIWIWCGNGVANLFDCVDQFLLKHGLDLPAATADAMIGQLYASRVFPVLIVSVASLIGGCLLPYLIQDWEGGRHTELRARMNCVVKFSALGFTVIAAITHIASPFLFSILLRGRYDHGLNLMPWGFVQYSWFALLAIAAKYLICVDKARAGILPLLCGLVAAISLNAVLAPRWGLVGVAIAMTIANGIAFMSLLSISSKCGMSWDRSTLLAATLPLTMCLGGWAALGIIAAILVGGHESKWLVSTTDREHLMAAVDSGLARLRRLRVSAAGH